MNDNTETEKALSSLAPEPEASVPSEILIDPPQIISIVPRRKLRVSRHMLCLCLVVLLLPFIFLALITAPGPLKEASTVVVTHGMGVQEIAALLHNKHVIYSAPLFRLASKLVTANTLKAGEYQFLPAQNVMDVVLKMYNGQSVARWFTVPEGLSAAEIMHLLQNDPVLTGQVSLPAEGTLLPETYRYNFGDGRAILVARMQKAMHEVLSAQWAKRDAEISLKTPHEALVMASLIEKETGLASERARIAGVFYNRLRNNMRLQSDPTVIYALTRGREVLNRELTHADLSFPSPYNTYASDGLPPEPICNPGRASIEAALHPEKNDFFYFVANGGGGHAFSRDLQEHNRNVMKRIQSH